MVVTGGCWADMHVTAAHMARQAWAVWLAGRLSGEPHFGNLDLRCSCPLLFLPLLIPFACQQTRGGVGGGARFPRRRLWCLCVSVRLVTLLGTLLQIQGGAGGEYELLAAV